MAHANPVLFTPGPVRIPPVVAEYLASPPCNYHRQEAFCAMLADNEADLKSLVGIAEPSRYFAVQITSTGTGANEACLLALAGAGKGLILRNGYFGNRLVEQAQQTGIDHVVYDGPHDRPLDPDAVRAVIDANPGLAWVYFVSHETRMGLKNPLEALGRVCKQEGLLVGADVISAAYAYPIDIEGSGVDLAVASSAKALQAAPGIGIVFVKLDAVDALRRGGRSRGYYLDVVAELDTQRDRMQPRFAQPVALHAAVRAACSHLQEIGIDNHMRRIRRQMDQLIAHLEGLGVESMLDPSYRSWIAVNFRLPESMPYPAFSEAMLREGFFVLYGIPGDLTHFQLSTIGDLDDDHIVSVQSAFTRLLGNNSERGRASERERNQ